MSLPLDEDSLLSYKMVRDGLQEGCRYSSGSLLEGGCVGNVFPVVLTSSSSSSSSWAHAAADDDAAAVAAMNIDRKSVV